MPTPRRARKVPDSASVYAPIVWGASASTIRKALWMLRSIPVEVSYSRTGDPSSLRRVTGVLQSVAMIGPSVGIITLRRKEASTTVNGYDLAIPMKWIYQVTPIIGSPPALDGWPSIA